ncbi:hypothetical protein [Mycobacterium leprae]|nr:hypothetical protein [Mycobacterium leprae]
MESISLSTIIFLLADFGFLMVGLAAVDSEGMAAVAAAVTVIVWE